MDYSDFCEKVRSELPINRKERFFTGTILPALLFHGGLSNFYSFLRLIDGFPEDINETDTGDSFLFFSEYNLKESAGERSTGQKIPTKSNDTPDIIIEILKPLRVFIIIEAKMFSSVTQEELAQQIIRQKKYVANPIIKKFGLMQDDIFHIALLPRELNICSSYDFKVLNWELFFDEKNFECSDNIFYNYLHYAIDNYDKLVQISPWILPPHVERFLTGQEIYNRGKENFDIWIGRKGGEATFVKDINTANWKKRKYCVSSEKPLKGLKGQWISGKEFAILVDKNCPKNYLS